MIPEEGVGLTSPAERDLIAKLELQASTPGRRRGYQERIGGSAAARDLGDKRGCPCRESECPKGQSSDFSRRTARCLGYAHSTGTGRRGDDEKSWRCKAGSKSEEEADCGLEDEAQRKGRRGRQSPHACGVGGPGTPESKGLYFGQGLGKGRGLARLAKMQGVWEAGAVQRLWACADRARSMSAFLLRAAAPGLTPAALGLKVFEGITTRDSRLGLAARGTFTDCFCGPVAGEAATGTCFRYPYRGNGLLSLKWCCTQSIHVGPAVGITAEYAANATGATGIWSLLCIICVNFLYSGCGHIGDLQVARGRPTAAQFAGLHQIVEAPLFFLSRAPEDGASVTPSLDYAKVLSRKRVGYGGQVAALPEALTLLEQLPGLPPEGDCGYCGSSRDRRARSCRQFAGPRVNAGRP